MANNFAIADADLPSAYYGGFANKENDFWKGFKGFLNKITPQPLKDFFTAVDMFKKNPRAFLDGWVADSPVGAAAGVLAAGLSGGLLLVAGGGLIGMVGRTGLAGITRLTGWATGFGGMFTGLAGVLTSYGLDGLAVTAVGGLTLGQLIRFAVSGVSHLWNFNWNITDKEIEQQQKRLLTSIYRQAGASIGALAGTLICGTLPVELIKNKHQKLIVDPTLFAELSYIKLNTPTFEYGEIYDELFESMKSLITITGRNVVQGIFLEAYKNIRRCVKFLAKATFIDKLPIIGKAIKAWGEEGTQSWSFASQTDDWIESIPNETLKEFTEEMIEEFQEICSENLMIVSYAV